MSDMACIYEMNLLEENSQVEHDLLAGRGMDVLFCLLDRVKTRREIAKSLEMPVYSVQLYLQRFISAGLVIEESELLPNGEAEKSYRLVSDEINIINQLENDPQGETEKKRKAVLSAQHFATMTRTAIKNVNMNPQKPNKIKAYFMKAKEEDMKAFQKELDLLFEKYQALEDADAADTYSLFTVLAPYEMED